MEIIKLVTGTLEENCYILKDGKECLVIDPGSDGKIIKEQIGSCKVVAVLLTHSHFDHIGALRDVIGKKNIPILKHRILEEQEYLYGPFSFEVLFTPGHSSDSVSYYFKEEKAVFTGDFIFKEEIGRCDLPTGDYEVMKLSLAKFKRNNPDLTLYPGHGDTTTLAYELEQNPYLKEV